MARVAGRRRAIAVFAVCAGLSARAAPAPPGSGFYVDVPYVRQLDAGHCGPAALTMLLRYWGRAADQYELAASTDPFPPEGLSGGELKALAVTAGLSAVSFAGTQELVLERLREGQPVMIAVAQRSRANHYLVLVGWDAAREEWIAHDPARGPFRRYPADDLGRQWRALEHWTLLVVPEER